MASPEDIFLSCADPFDLELILRLQLDDVQDRIKNAKGKGREGAVPDADVALQMHYQDLQDNAKLLADRRMAHSMSVAVQDDGDLIQTTAEQDRRTEADRQYALALAGHRSSTNLTMPTKDAKDKESAQAKEEAAIWRDSEMLAKVAALYNKPQSAISTASPVVDTSCEVESSQRAATRSDNTTEPRSRCAACGEHKDFFDVARVPCNHEYCRQCLQELFALSLRDETLFPPRCDGQEIPLGRVRFFLPSHLANEFEARYLELSTKNRTYCHEATCSTFIHSTAISDDIGTCPKCRATTCVMCKHASHSGDCPQDSALNQLIDMAESQQWQRCYACKRFVELNMGCNHMTCHCGAQFCYVCGSRWKTCKCAQWDERRLYNRAAQIVDRDPHRRLFQPPRTAHAQPTTRPGTHQRTADDTSDQVRAAMAHLRQNHECSHDNWRYVSGRHVCEECSWFSTEYIFECRQCQLQACNRCRRNRL